MNLIFQLESLEQAQETLEKGLSMDNEQLLELEEQNKESCNVTMNVNINTKMLLRGLYPQKEHVTFSPQSFVYKYEVEDVKDEEDNESDSSSDDSEEDEESSDSESSDEEDSDSDDKLNDRANAAQQFMLDLLRRQAEENKN
jgi:hypothetical protein